MAKKTITKKESQDVFSSLKKKRSSGFDSIQVNVVKPVYDLVKNSFMKIFIYTAQKMKFFSKCDQIRSFQRIRLHLLKKSLMENFIFCAVLIPLQWNILRQT